MLFTFNKFWKSLFFLVVTWISYGIWGFEFTAVTLLSIACILQLKDDNFHL
jgi:hypothetical protein